MPPRERVLSWHELGLSGRKAFFAGLGERLPFLFERLCPSGSDNHAEALQGSPASRLRLWSAVRRLVEATSWSERPRLSCHLIFLALARHRSGVCYSLTST